MYLLKNYFVFHINSYIGSLNSIFYSYNLFVKVGKLIAIMAEDGEDWKEVSQTAGKNELNYSGI